MFLNELVACADPKIHLLWHAYSVQPDWHGEIMRDSIDVSHDQVDTIAVFK
jgi:hypothetical protein